MQSSNPVFARTEGFNGRGSGNAYGNQPQAGGRITYPAYGTPTTTSYGPGHPGLVDDRRMTIDSVVQKTGVTLGLVILTAALTWVFLPNELLGMAWMGGALVGFALGMFLCFRRTISPPLVLAYAAVQGVFLGAMSETFEVKWDGIVLGAVVGTFAAAAGTLAAYKFFNITVTDKFRKYVVAAMFGFVALILFDLVLGFFGSAIGINGFGPLGLLMSVVGLGLGILLLILDFDFVERGIAASLPEVESWRAAFGLTVTIIWIYIEIMRILAILRGSD